MNFDDFNGLYANAEVDEIKVIGKDIEKDGRFYHIVGMTLKEKKATVYILEIEDDPSKNDIFQEKTPRESLKSSMKLRKNDSFFMHIREFQCDGKIYETAGASSGPIKNSEYEVYILFLKMRQAGWEVAADSAFFDVDWECLSITNIHLRDELESLPEWTDDMQVLVDIMPEEKVIELPVVLECGKTNELEYEMEDGSLGGV